MSGDPPAVDPAEPEAPPSRRGFWLRTIVGISISVIALWLVFRDVDLQSAVEILRTADPLWIGVMLVAMLADIAVRTLRWRVILAPVAKVRYIRAAGYLTVGYAANNVLPARLGELVRAHYVGDREGVSRAAALGTIVVERVIDFAAVVAIAAGALLVLGIRGDVGTAVLIGAAVAVGLVAALVVGVFAHRLPGASWVERQASRFPRIVDLAATFRAGLSVAGRPRTLGPAVLLTLLAWSVTTASFAAGGRAVGIDMTVPQAAFLAAGVSLVTAIPSGPGFVGTWELAAVRILALYGVAGDTAVAFALLVHVSSLAITTGLGAISFLRLGWLPKAVAGAAADPKADPGATAGSTADPGAAAGSTADPGAPDVPVRPDPAEASTEA
jgi:glycosyltransferase 2 family protein